MEQHAGRGGEKGVRRVDQGEEKERERRVSVGEGPREEQEPIEISLSPEAEEEPERFPGGKERQGGNSIISKSVLKIH